MNSKFMKLNLDLVWMSVLLISACNPTLPTPPTASTLTVTRLTGESIMPSPSPPLTQPLSLTLTSTPVISQPLSVQNPIPVYPHVTAHRLHNIPASYLEQGEQQIIRYAECKDCLGEPSTDLHTRPWYELSLPDGEPRSISYPHTDMITPTIRQKLSSDSMDFYQFRISPSGKNIIFTKFPAKHVPLALFQADEQGNKVQMIESFPSSVLEVVWSKDERTVLACGSFWEGDTQGYDVHYVDLDHSTAFNLSPFTPNNIFLPCPSLSPDKTLVAGPLRAPNNDNLHPLWDELVVINTQTKQLKDYRIASALVRPQWSEDGRSLYVLGQQGEVYQFDVVHETLTLLARIENMNSIFADIESQIFPSQWLIFPEQQRLVIGSKNGLWLIEYSQ